MKLAARAPEDHHSNGVLGAGEAGPGGERGGTLHAWRYDGGTTEPFPAAPVRRVLAILKSLLVMAAVQATPGQPPQAPPPGPADPATEGAVEVGAVDAALTEHEVDVTLRGSPASMARQHAVAVASDLSFVGTLEEMEALAEEGELVPVDGGRHYEVMDWVFPFGIPDVRTFVERMAVQYRRACGEAMVVTSLTRPYSEQLPNSHQLSVHPAGMAIDLRIPRTPDCREFLEARLLAMEEEALLDITRELSPPHYHVALFPEPYAAWVETQPELPGVTPPPGDEEGAQGGQDERDPWGGAWPGAWSLVVALALVLVGLGAWRYRERRRAVDG